MRIGPVMLSKLALYLLYHSLPKLNPGTVEKSYIEEKDGVAQADSSRLLDKEQRRLGNGLRVVEEPVFGVTKAQKVRDYQFSHHPLFMRKTSQFSSLTQISGPSWTALHL